MIEFFKDIVPYLFAGAMIGLPLFRYFARGNSSELRNQNNSIFSEENAATQLLEEHITNPIYEDMPCNLFHSSYSDK